MQCKVVFRPSGREVAVEAGTKISEAARLAGVEIATPCGGIGRCGRCTVLIDGDFEDRVLACMTQIDRDMTITIPEDSGRVVAATDDKHLDIDELSPLSDGLGLAVDIGTTTVALDILRMDTGEELYSSADVNLQKRRGDDVLARIQYAAVQQPGSTQGRIEVRIVAVLVSIDKGGRPVVTTGGLEEEHVAIRGRGLSDERKHGLGTADGAGTGNCVAGVVDVVLVGHDQTAVGVRSHREYIVVVVFTAEAS